MVLVKHMEPEKESLRQCIQDLEASITAFNGVTCKDPATRCLSVACFMRWARHANERIDEYLENLSHGICKEVLSMYFERLTDQAYWLDGKIEKEMMAYSAKPLKTYGLTLEFETSADLYKAYEEALGKLADNLKKVEDTFDQPELYGNLMQELKKNYHDRNVAYEYRKAKREYLKIDNKIRLRMQVQACVEYLKSGIMNNILDLSDEDIDGVDEELLHKLLTSKFKKPDNLKELWAKLKQFIELKENVLIVPKRGLIRSYVLKHFYDLTDAHLHALFRLDMILMLIHQDMVKEDPRLEKYLAVDASMQVEEKNYFAVVRNILESMRKDWFWDLRTDKKYNKTWIENFLNALMATEWGERIAREWRRVSSRVKLECKIIGTLIDAGVLGVSYNAIASMLDYPDFTDDSLGIYVGLGKKEAYFKWVCEYVKA